MSDATTYAPEISDLGEKIVSLTLIKAVELADYLEKVHNIKPAAGGAAPDAPAVEPAGGGAAPDAPAGERTAEDVARGTLSDLDPPEDLVDVDTSDMNKDQLNGHLAKIENEMTTISAEIMKLPNKYKSASMEQLNRLNALERVRQDAEKQAGSLATPAPAEPAPTAPTSVEPVPVEPGLRPRSEPLSPSPDEIASLRNRTGARPPDTAARLRPTLETSPVSMEQLDTQVSLLPEAERPAMRESIAELRAYQAAMDSATDPDTRAAYQEEVNNRIEALRSKGILKSS